MAEVTTAPVKRGQGRPRKVAAPPTAAYECDDCGAVERDGRVEHESSCAVGRQLAGKRKSRKVAPALAAPGEVVSVARSLEETVALATNTPVRRERRTPAVSAARYTAQVVIMTEPEHAALARAWATKLKRVQADVLREIFEAGIRQCGEIWAVEHGNLSGRTLGAARRDVQEMADARTERRRKFNAARPTRSD